MNSFAVQLGRHALADRGDDLYETPALFQARLAFILEKGRALPASPA